MATELLQDLEGLSVSADVDHAYLQAGVTSFDEVEEIVKSNLRMISELTHDENAQDGFPEGYDLLGILNLQSSDLDEKDTADSIAQEKIVSKDGGENAGYSNLEITADGSEMLQASKDLLDDITLVINSDKNFTNNHLLLTAEKEGLEGDRKEMPGLVKAGKLDVALRLLDKESTSASTKTPVNGECPLEDVDNANRDLKLRNSKPRGAWPEKGVYFEQCLNDLLDGDTSEVLTTPQEQNVYHEYLLEDSKSLDSMPESLLVERSAAMLPDQLFRDLSGTAKVAAKSRLANQAHDDHDVTVDGEGGDNTDGSSLDLCQLTYDENLTCSFFELLQLHNDDNSELIEHGQRGRPPRQKVTRQAVPCKIEPKVSQAGLQPSFFPPQLFSSTFRNIQPELTSAVPSQLQPRLGQEVMRFPVVLQSKTSASGQLYLEVCPDVTQIASSSQASARSSTSPPQGRSSPKGNSEKSCVSSHIEVTSAQPNLAASTDRSSHLPGDGPKVSQNNFSLEIDGPIRRQTSLSQVRNGSSRNDPYLRMIMENSGQAVGSPLEEAYRMQTVQENQISTMSSHNFLPSSSVSSSQNLMRAENVSGFGGNMQHGMPYISTSMEGSLYQNNQRFPVPNTFINYGMHDQPSQYMLPTNNHHYELGSNTSSTNSHSRYFGNGVSGEPMGNWTSEPNINMAASSANHCLQNNNPVRHTVTSAAVPYARTGSPGMPNIPVDPLSRRVRMLMAMGSHGQRQMNNDSSSEVYSTTTPQNVVRLPALNNEHNSSMIQLSPPAELRMQQFVHQQPVNVPPAAHVPSSGATADGSVMDKSVLHAKSSPSQSSTRSSKGPELPVPVERSKARVEKWLNNNVMFRPDLDSGTFDPSDHSLVHEPSVPHMAHQYVEAAGSGQALSEQSYEFVGLFEGKRMMVVPPQPSSKQKPGKRTSALNHHGRGSPLAQIGQTRDSIISDASVITESSLSSGHTNSSKGKHADSKHDAFNDSQEKPAGRKPAGLHTDTPMSTSAAFNPKNPITRQSPQQELPMPTQSLSGCPVGQLDENQQADWAIAEGMKFLEQTSFEKRLAGISSTSSGHVLSELEQYLRCEMKSSSGGTSGNHPGSGFKMEGVVGGTSKQSSFDTSKYITPSYIESLEKKTQNGKSSIDNYLDHVKYISNESMHAEQKTSPPSDGKQLTNIPLNDIAEVIGFQGEVSQQPSRLGSCLPPPQFDNRQKALKRRPADHSDETTYQTEQTVAAAGQNAGMGEQNVAFGGPEVVVGGQHVVLGEQNVAMRRQSGPVGGQNATVCGQDTAVCGQNATVGRNNITYAMQTDKIPQVPASVHGMTQAGQPISANYLASKTQNYGDQHFIVFAEQGGIPQTVIGPPTTQPDYFANSGLPQYAKSRSSSTALSGPTQSKPVYESQSFQAIPADQVASQTLLSGKMQSGFQLPDFSDSCYETEMISSPSSMEILKESSPMSNHEFFNLADATGNPSVPVASVSCTQHIMQSGANKIAPAVALFTQSPSLSSSTHSTVTSASHVGNTIFKKPQAPCGSSGSPAAVHRGGTPNYPSVGGDSDVSMSSDTSLPNSMTVHDVSMDPKMLIHQRQTSPLHQQQTSPQQHFEQNSVQFQQINPQQLVPKMSQSTQQPVQHQKQQQLLSQQHEHLQMQQNQQQQQQLLLQQQKHQQIEQSQLQQMMASQQQCLQMQNQQINNQDYYQMQKKQQEMLNQQNLQFRTKQQMISQQQQQQEQHQLHQEIQHNDQHGDDNQQKQLQHLCHQQQFEELLLQQQQPNQQEQFYLMQVQKQQEIQQQRQHLQQQIQHLQQQIQQQEQNSQQQIQQQEQHSQQQVQQQGHLQQQFQQPGHLQQQIQQPGHLQQQIQQPGHLQQQIQQPGHLQQQIQQPGHLQQQIQQPGQLQQQIQQQGQLQQQIQQPGQLQQQIQQPGHLQQQIQQQGQHLQQQIQKPKQHPQQQIPQLGQHLQQQTANQQHLQTQNQQQQQHLHLQSQQQLHTQQSPKQPAEISQSHPLQNQQQMQQYQWLLNRQRYQQMQLLQQQQIQQQQKQMENQQLQQQPRLYQQQQEQHSEHCPTLNSTCIPRRAPSSQAGSSHSEPQPSRTLPSAKIVKRSMSQISDYIYSQQLASLSPASETTHDLQASIADNDLACVPQDCLQLTGRSIQSGHGNNVFNNLDKNSMSGQNQQPGLQNFIQPPFGNQPLGNTAAGNTEIAAHDQILKSATEIQLQKYLKEGFPSLNSVEYCPQALGVSSFSPANSPPRNKPQQSVANTGQGLDSGGPSESIKSNRVHQAERSREEADSDLSAFSLGSGEDLLSFQQDNDGETPLHLLSELPKEGISSLPSMPGFYEALNLQNKNQETALDIAVKNENLDAVKFLVSHGADVNIFCLSSQKGSGSKTVHRNETVQQTALHEAVELGNTQILKVLLSSQNVKVDARRPDSGLTPLMLALQLHRQADRQEIISELINHQASLSLHDTIQGKTPLMFAIQSRDVSLVERILQQVGAEKARVLVSDRAKKEMTCLHFAAELRLESLLKKRLLRCIIVAGGDPSAKNSEGETPRDWAKADINEVLQNLARLFNP